MTMAEGNWAPTFHLRWNRRTDADPLTFFETTLFGGGKSPRPIGYRLEQKWTSWRTDETCGTGQGWIDEEWRQVPFADECMPAVPELDVNDKQFLPVGPT